LKETFKLKKKLETENSRPQTSTNT